MDFSRHAVEKKKHATKVKDVKLVKPFMLSLHKELALEDKVETILIYVQVEEAFNCSSTWRNVLFESKGRLSLL